MSDVTHGDEVNPQMPEPTPVYDVTFAHIYSGEVYSQFYFFLWMSLAFFIGAVLPWNGVFGNEGYTIWQGIMMVCSAGAFWSSIASIKSRRLCFWPILAIELLAVLFVLLHFRDVQATSAELQLRHKAAIQAEMDKMPMLEGAAGDDFRRLLDARLQAVDDVFPLKFGNVFGAPVQGLFLKNDLESDESMAASDRFKATTAWNSYGSGFHLTWISLLVLTVFIGVSIGQAFKSAKPKEDPAEARRKAREARDAAKKKEAPGEQDETKV